MRIAPNNRGQGPFLNELLQPITYMILVVEPIAVAEADELLGQDGDERLPDHTAGCEGASLGEHAHSRIEDINVPRAVDALSVGGVCFGSDIRNAVV